MNNHESAMADFYDHEQESSPTGRREAPDWGGDDLFTTTPRRRRFDRPVRGDHPTDRFDRARRRETMEHPVPHTPARVMTYDPAVGFDAPNAVATVTPVEAPDVEGHLQALAQSWTPEPEPVGRRTVTVTGHPDGGAIRRRPAPSFDERLVGSRPERIAAYAFALGLLLIVIAFLSAHA